tara:strand:- start:1542 stop:2405 length:864 start_codon:yes stop_codon:yes gene_type:complete
MKTLIIQENGRHEGNRNFRECFCAQRAFIHHGHEADIWGLGHISYTEGEPDYESYDLIINLENYDETGWVPNLAKVQAKKFLWSIDAHVKGIQSYLKTANEGNYDLILQATPEFVVENSVWFPNCYDDSVIYHIPPKADAKRDERWPIGFCGNIVNRGGIIQILKDNFSNFKLDEFVIGEEMVEAINSYKIHFNANISIDINYRNFETMGCKTCLLTSYNQHYEELGMVDGKNCLTYRNMDEMVEKARFALENGDFRTSISNNGYVLAQEHTYKKRIETLIKSMKEN